MNIVAPPMSSDEIKSVIQGPGDVEWRCVGPLFRLCMPSAYVLDTKCEGNVKRFSPASGSGHSWRPNLWRPFSRWASPTCNVLVYFFLHRDVADHTAHSVCIRDAKEAFSVRPRFEQHFSYMTLDVEDNEEQNLIRLFPGCVYLPSIQAQGAYWTSKYRAKAFIDTAINQGGRVLVHCNGDYSRSYFGSEEV